MSRYGKRLANKAHRMQIRQMRSQSRAAAADVRQTASDYGVRESVRSELMTRQDQPHAAIAAHLGIPQWVVDVECRGISDFYHALCPHAGS